MVELQIVVLVVAGSSPVDHPFINPKIQIPSSKFSVLGFGIRNLGLSNVVSVAQLDRASDFGSEGCGFKSLQARTFSRVA